MSIRNLTSRNLSTREAKYYITNNFNTNLGICVLHYEAIKFLDEIANTNPELLQSASCIDLKTTQKGDIEIIIQCRISDCDLELLNHLVNAKNFNVSYFSDNIWVIS